MESKGEQVLSFIIYMISAGLAIYSVFSRLSFNSKLFFLPLSIALIFGYLGLSRIGCGETSAVMNSLITFFGIAGLAIYETYVRRKDKKRTKDIP